VNAAKGMVDSVAEQLVYGSSKLRIVGPPFVGKSHFLIGVSKAIRLEAPGVLVEFDGRTFTEENQDEKRDALVATVEATVDSLGNAVLVFDHYEKAVRRNRGRTLQKHLFGLLVNDDKSRNIGCLFAHRSHALSTLEIASSPFLSRLRPLPLPAESIQTAEVVAVAGTLEAFISQGSEPLNGAFRPELFKEFLLTVSSSIARDLRDSERKAILEANRSGGALSGESSFVVSLADPATGSLAVGMGPLVAALSVFEGNWPTDQRASLDRFVRLCEALGPCYWYDKFLLAPRVTASTIRFLTAYSGQTDVPLKILTSYDTLWQSGSRYEQACSTINGLSQVDIRTIDRSDAINNHDRHLKSRFDSSAFTLPQGSEIVCHQTTGNSNSGSTDLTNDYNKVWARAREHL
jgi:hypothetical protein